jgi:hypothetical protein
MREEKDWCWIWVSCQLCSTGKLFDDIRLLSADCILNISKFTGISTNKATVNKSSKH